MIEQAAIAVTGVTAIFLTQSRSERVRKYACLFGMVGQPFWIWAAISAQQWGILLLTFFYTFAWAKGVWTHWIRPAVPEVNPLSRRAFVMTEPHLSGHRVIVGFEDREEAMDAHEHIAKIEKSFS